jgi:dienelactone hydrolase
MTPAADVLADFERTEFTAEGKTRDVYRIGSGPGVIVISEMPGITPRVADFGRIVARDGFTAVLPHVFGEPGREVSVPYVLSSVSWGCISREFSTMALRRTSPITNWLRALARAVHAELGGPGVGVVGMCFTGGFALAMMVDDTVMAPVLSQPSLPFALTRAHRRDLGISDDDLARVKERVRASEADRGDEPGLCLLALRFTGDKLAPADRFQRLRDELGDGVVTVEIDSSPGNAWGIKGNAHSVLTEELVADDPDHPTRQALDQVLDLFRTRLRPGPDA